MHNSRDWYKDAAGDTLPELELSVRDWYSMSPALQKALTQSVIGRFTTVQRWFREKSLVIRNVSLIDWIGIESNNDRTWLLVVEVDFSLDKPPTYAIPVAAIFGDRAREIEFDSALATIDGPDGYGVLYDGMYSPAFRRQLVRILASEEEVKGKTGSLTIKRGHALRRFANLDEIARSSRVLSVEQSNSSILYNDALFFKMYRKLESGINPDVELLRYLSESGGFNNVPPYVGSIDYVATNGDNRALGLFMAFVPNHGDAWSYATKAVDRYFERLIEVEQTIDTEPPRPTNKLGTSIANVAEDFRALAGDSFIEMMSLLGTRTAELHRALATDLDRSEFRPEPFSESYQRSVYRSIRDLYHRVTEIAKGSLADADRRTQNPINDFLALEDVVLDRLSSIISMKIAAEKTRIHGDYHLGQVLFTGRDFMIIDLEGEPARTLEERRLKFSALRDVAGMLRSFHYAISSRYRAHIDLQPENETILTPWVSAWYEWVRAVFLDAYLKGVANATFIPSDDHEVATLLDVFVLEKAIYEVGYEINNRPDWLPIPLDGIRFVCGRS